MNKNNKRFLIVSISIALVFAIIVSTILIYNREIVNSYDWQPSEEIVVSLNPGGDGCYAEFESQVATTDYAEYYADSSLSKKKKDRFVTYSEELLGFLKPEKKVVYYIYNGANSFITNETDQNIIHISSNSAKSLDMIIITLQSMTEHYAHYGLSYGIAAEIYEELGWGKITTISNDAVEKFVKSNKDIDLYDLTYPCFMTDYTDKNDIEIAKALSVEFVKFLNINYGQEKAMSLLELSAGFNFEFEHWYDIYMNEFLKIYDCPYFVSPPTELIRYSTYVSSFPLRITTISCLYFFEKEYESKGYKEYKLLFELNHQTLKSVLIDYEKSFKQIREDFCYEESDLAEVAVKISDMYIEANGAGGTTSLDGDIRVIQLFAMVHEYVHSVSVRKFGHFSNWTTEAICEYYGLLTTYGSKYTDITNLYYRYLYNGENYPIIQERQEFYLQYMAKNNLAFDIFDFIDAAAVTNPKDSPLILTVSLGTTAYTMSFTFYIINTYGIEKMIYLTTNPNAFYTALGITEKEILAEWQGYLENKFS